MAIMVLGMRLFESKAQRIARVVAEETAARMAQDSIAVAGARKAFVAKQLDGWKETVAKGTVLDDVMAVPGKALELHKQAPEHLSAKDITDLLHGAVKQGAALTATADDVVKVVSLPHSSDLKPFMDRYVTWFGDRGYGEATIALNFTTAAPSTAKALALAETLRPIDGFAADQATAHASKVAGTFEEALNALKVRVSKPSETLRWNWKDKQGTVGRAALHDTTVHAKDPVDVMKALSYLGSNDAERSTWLASTIGQENTYQQAWTLARTARILGDTKAESAALTQATAEAKSVKEALSIAAVAREGRLEDPVINDAIVKASTLATEPQHEGVLELADKIRKGIILEEARRPKVKVTVNNRITVSGGSGDLPEAHTLGQAIMDYFGMRRNGGNYR